MYRIYLRSKYQILFVNQNLYCSPNIFWGDLIEKNEACGGGGHVTHRGERRDLYRVVVGKPEGKRPLGRPRRR